MQNLATLFAEKMFITLLVASVFFLLYFSLDIYLFLTRRDFGNIDIYVADFTQNKKTNESVLRFELIGHKVPLKEIYRNRFHTLRVMLAGIRAELGAPVLRFYGQGDRILKPMRNRISTLCASMVLKRASGFNSAQNWYQICIAYDRSDDVSHYILKAVLVKDTDIDKFEHYLRHPPRLGTNFEFLKKIVAAYESPQRNEQGSFIQVRMTTA